MKFRFNVEMKDVWAYIKNARIYSRRQIKLIRLVTIIFLISSFLIFLGSNLFQTFLYTFIASFIIFPLFEKYSAYLRFKISIKKYTHLLGEKNITLNEDGMTVTPSTKTSIRYWNEFARVVEENDYLFIYLQNESAYTIPLLELSSDDQQQLRKWLSEHTGPIIQHEPPSKQEQLTKVRLILLVFFIALAIINTIQQSRDVLAPIKSDVANLFHHVDDYEDIGDLLHKDLIIKDTVTQEDIDRLYNRLSMIHSKNVTFFDKFHIASLIKEAEQLIYDDLPNITQIYSGEGEYWEIEEYQIKANPVLFRTFEGNMYMKEQDVYEADYFMVEVHVVFEDNLDVRLHDMKISVEHSESVKPESFDISTQSTGEFAPDHASYRNENGDPVRIEDITEVYLIVQWQGQNEVEIKEEKIILSPVK